MCCCGVEVSRRQWLYAGLAADAHAKEQPAIVADVEGCDFLEGKLERLEEAYRRGVRVFGARVVRELNRLGAVVDIAHATESATRQAAKVATRPLLLSHTALGGLQGDG
jgi:membrane dipeptidase